MTWFIYNICIHLLKLGMYVHSLFNAKSRKGIHGRQNFPKFQTKKEKRVIIHCASLGEYEQAKPIIAGCKANDIEVVLTFFSPSGYEARSYADEVDYVCYLPLDTKHGMKSFLQMVNPDLIILVKYELWWNLIRSGYPVIIISAVFTPKHYLFRSWANALLNCLQQVEQIFLIDQDSYELLDSKGIKNITLAGDTRIESILERKEKHIEDEVLSKFCGDANVIIFGSTYPVEHKEILRIIDNYVDDYQVIIFPHEIDHKEIFQLKDQLGKDCVIYSEWKDRPVFKGHSMMIVDTIGLLKDAYRFANIAYVGGGFGHGLHNILEPFAYKIPLVFGPKFEGFPEARILSKTKFVKTVESIGELEEGLELLKHKELKPEIDKYYNIIFDAGGKASTKIINFIKGILWK